MKPDGRIATVNLVVFVRSLREAGFSVRPGTTDLLVSAASIVGFENAADVRDAFRSVVASSQRQAADFDGLFDRFFTGDVVLHLDDVVDRLDQTRGELRAPRIGATGIVDGADDDDLQEVIDVVGASAAETLMDVDFADLDAAEAASVAALLATMIWSPSSVRSRRWRATTNGSVPDLRRTLRSVTGPSGDLLPLSYAERRRRQRPLVVLADISGSMERYSEMLLHFVHGAHHRFTKVESFVFATRLTRITRQLRRRSPGDAVRDVTRVVNDWSGGTRIGDAIADYNSSWARRVGGGGPIVLVISDGWDTGEPERLALQMQRLARSAHRVIWLNPLAGHDGFTPEARGMAAALPFVGDLLAGGTARNLTDLIDLLQTTGRSSGSQERSAVAS
ncbi:MAG: VWA domain-containing protein [Actinomycetia bacterium]|nr:VWA domain-containing protein [Actinomycetes bacterium]